MILNKKDMARQIADKYEGVSIKTANEMVERVLDVIAESVANGDEVRLFGFGSFVPKTRPAHEARNPRTGEKMTVEEKKVVVFKPAKAFADTVNGETN